MKTIDKTPVKKVAPKIDSEYVKMLEEKVAKLEEQNQTLKNTTSMLKALAEKSGSEKSFYSQEVIRLQDKLDKIESEIAQLKVINNAKR